jgi:hypothetical protein
MATNSFLGFSEDGTQLFEMKSKMARQTGDDVAAAIKTTIRTTLGVPGSAEGLVPSQNLADVSSAATARTNLDVMATADVNDRALSKGPSNGLYFDGASKVDFAPSSATDFGTGDLTILAVVKVPDSLSIVNTVATTRTTGVGIQLAIWPSGRLIGNIQDSSGSTISLDDGTDLTGRDSVHVAISCDRSGNMVRYVDGVSDGTDTVISTRALTLTNGNGVSVGYKNSEFYWNDGNINSVLVFNRLLTAAEILRLSKNGNVPEVADQYGGALGGIKDETTWSGATGGVNTVPTGFSFNGTTTYTAATKTTQTTALNMVGNSGNGMYLSGALVVGRRYRVEVKIFETAGGIKVSTGSAHITSDGGAAWKTHIAEFVAGTTYLTFYLDATSSDVWLDDLLVTEIGAVLSLNPDNIESDGDWIDASSNRLNGTNTGASVIKKDIRLDLDDTDAATGETILNVGTGFEVLKGGAVKNLGIGDSSELTIATAAITVTGSFHIVDTEGDAATDDLQTINGGSEGDILILRQSVSGRDVTLKDNTGNLRLAGDCNLTDSASTITLIKVSANWFEIARSINA